MLTRRPVLYPNEALQTSGPDGADRAINECMQLADGYVKAGSGQAARPRAMPPSAAGRAPPPARSAARSGQRGPGAAAGAAAGVTAGVLNSLFNGSGGPSATYQNFVNTCLAERGYRVIGLGVTHPETSSRGGGESVAPVRYAGVVPRAAKPARHPRNGCGRERGQIRLSLVW
jgi:hypothetical protein